MIDRSSTLPPKIAVSVARSAELLSAYFYQRLGREHTAGSYELVESALGVLPVRGATIRPAFCRDPNQVAGSETWSTC